ncbi:protein singed [Mixta mediterraneensis]|uniref:protein singed n=1 Tax=Mixta mediterraneensis TaxID=2758443 RepID=UPI001876F861|nr:protein singed [Mixta mediterraneensis]MBE5254516.1 protein singed [Mixta mediterraneensis]
MIYITVSDVDDILGTSWTDDSKKAKAVLQANAYMTALNLQNMPDNPVPDDVKQAGAYIASVAASGNLYKQKSDSGLVTSKSVKAGSTQVTKSFAALDSSSSSLLDPDLQLALAMLQPWMGNPLAFRVYR